jgi:uncharacterized protein YlaI
MKRITQAPNLAIATLWCDQLCSEGYPATVQRAYASGIAGHIPPDQALPEVWVVDDRHLDAAKARLAALRNRPERRWVCAACDELVEGPFEQCWNCGGLCDQP